MVKTYGFKLEVFEFGGRKKLVDTFREMPDNGETVQKILDKFRLRRKK